MSHTAPRRLSAEAVIGVERTRATFLRYPEHVRADFTTEITALLEPRTHIDLIQESLLAMAQRHS